LLSYLRRVDERCYVTLRGTASGDPSFGHDATKGLLLAALDEALRF
jgi:hypothetical protein